MEKGFWSIMRIFLVQLYAKSSFPKDMINLTIQECYNSNGMLSHGAIHSYAGGTVEVIVFVPEPQCIDPEVTYTPEEVDTHVISRALSDGLYLINQYKKRQELKKWRKDFGQL